MASTTTEELGEARRQFDRASAHVRPDLHRFCTRMTGNACDGEDLVQDTLVLAFYRLAELREGTALRGWLFRIAHNKCIDFLRGKRRFEGLEAVDDEAEEVPMEGAFENKRRVERAFATLVTGLPPKERACVLLKDLLDLSLEETAEVTGSNVGAVKAALHRGRTKLEEAERAPHRRVAPIAFPPDQRLLLDRYIEAFNRRDWNAVQALLAAEARLEVVHRSEGPFKDACYFVNHERLPWEWKLGLAFIDGVEEVVRYRRDERGEWAPHSIVQLDLSGGAIRLVRDYIHVDYLLSHSLVG